MEHIYLDNSATTPLCQGAVDGIHKAIENFANPSSLHSLGHGAEKEINLAREAIAAALNIKKDSYKIVFTSGGTEANNLAITGVANAKNYKNPKIIVSNSEHPCILEPVKALENKGFKVVYLPTVNGEIDENVFYKEMDKDTVLVSIMTVNNETGAIYDIKKLFAYAKRVNPNVVCHTDAVQAFLKIPFSPLMMGADLVSISSHKIHGPKGCGALVIAKPLITAKKLSPILLGGGQEDGIRSGTENTVGIMGMGGAVGELFPKLKNNVALMTENRNYLISVLPQDVKVNAAKNTAPHIINITVPGIKSETMLHFLSSKGIYVSSGSACSSHKQTQSHVLLGFGLSKLDADCSIRVSISPETTKEQLDVFVHELKNGMDNLVKIN